MGFGDFNTICRDTALPLCPLVGSATGIPTECYSRSIELANTIIFQGAASFMHIIALIMTVFMIFHVHSKFTAVGRKEFTTFLNIFFLLTILSLIIDSGVVPPGSPVYPYFVAIQSGVISAFCMSLMVNGFVAFQTHEDGTPLSVWLIRGSSMVMFAVTFVISLLTFKSWGGLGPKNTTGLFVVLYLFNAIMVTVYAITQFIHVNALKNLWPLGNLLIGIFFFIVGQVVLYAFGSSICEKAQHYLDGIFIATTCNLLTVMMIYKYWDSLTVPNYEFSVTAYLEPPLPAKAYSDKDDRQYTLSGQVEPLGPFEYASSSQMPSPAGQHSYYAGGHL